MQRYVTALCMLLLLTCCKQEQSTQPDNDIIPEDTETLTSIQWNAWHKLGIYWDASSITFWVDNLPKVTWNYAYDGTLPLGIWNDRPSIMSTDWVEINSVPLPVPAFLLLTALISLAGLRRMKKK